MPENKKYNIKLKILKPYIIGALKGFLVFFILFLLMALVIYKFNSDNVALYYLVYLFLVLGGFITGASVYKKVRGRGFLTGVIASLPYSLLAFLLIGSIMGFNISGDILLVFLLTLSGGFLGGVTAANTKI